MTATHAYQDDPRNASILICVNGEHKPRAEAVVSVFDSGFILGDGVWEGLRLHNGKLAFLENLYGQIAGKRKEGLGQRQIVRQLKKHDDLFTRLLTLGNVSFTQMVRSALQSIDAGEVP